MKFSLRSLATALLPLAFCALPSLADPTTQPIDDAIAHLGDPDPAVREHATKVLREAGAAARTALEEAAKGDDPEVAARAKVLLRAVPVVRIGQKTEPEEVLPDVIQYRTSNAVQKQQMIVRLGQSPDGVRVLARLWVDETNQELRAALFEELMKKWSPAAATFLADGKIDAAELVLSTALAKKEDNSPQAYAAYWRSRGQLDSTLKQWAPHGGKPPVDLWTDQVLAALYRANGDAKAAIVFAKACDDPNVLQETLLWAGDWARLAVELHKNDGNAIVAPNIRDVGFLTGVDALAGNEKAVNADVVKLTGMVHSETDAHEVADFLLLINRPDEAVKVLTDAKQFAAVYDLLSDRGRDDDAAALVAANDADPSAEAMALRAVAAKQYARQGLKKQCSEMIERVAKENAEIKYPHVFALLAEAEREAGMTEKAWEHYADAVEKSGEFGGGLFAITHAFPSKENGVEWARLWYASLQRRPDADRGAHLRELFELTRREYDRSMPIGELVTLVKDLDLVDNQSEWRVKLVWEAAVRLKKDGREKDAVALVTELAPKAASGELYIDLGDWAVEKKDWALAVERYGIAWRKDRTDPLAMYLHGWAMERAGMAAEGRDRMQLAHLLSLGDEKRREDLIEGLQARRLDDAAIREADVMIRTGQPLSAGSEVALRTAAERADERGDGAVAFALWQRTMTNFLHGTYSFRFEPAYLHLPDMIRRAHARALLAAGEMSGVKKDIALSFEMLPTDSAMAIDLVPDLDKLGKHQEADELFGKIFSVKKALCERYPNSAWHHNECAWLAAKCHRELDKALVYAKRAVELDPTNAADIDTLAEVYFHQGHFKEAVELEKKCVELSDGQLVHRKQLERFEAGGK